MKKKPLLLNLEMARRGSLPNEDEDSPTYLQGVRLPDSAEPPDPDQPVKPLTWVVFGATSRLGTALVRTLLRENERVCAVTWTHGSHSQIDMQVLHLKCQSPFQTRSHDAMLANYLPRHCDLRLPASIQSILSTTLSRFGTVDIVVNFVSAPLVISPCEDEDEADLRRTWETIVMGSLGLLQTFLPHFKAKDEGRFVFGSKLGFDGGSGVPGVGGASAAVAALEGILESLVLESETEREVKGEEGGDGKGVKVTMVSTGFLDGDTQQAASIAPSHESKSRRLLPSSTPSKPSAIQSRPTSTSTSTSPAQHIARARRWAGTWNPTSTTGCAELLWQLGHCQAPPVRLPLGSFAVEAARERNKALLEELDDWRRLGFAGGEDGDGEGNWEGEGEGEMEGGGGGGGG